MRLKPCPFCGGEAFLVDDGSYTSISHRGCPGDVGGFEGDGAAETWNSRPIEDGQAAILGNAMEALRNLATEMRHMLSANPKKDGGLYRQRLDEADAAIARAEGRS
jgi:hypothetical protein